MRNTITINKVKIEDNAVLLTDTIEDALCKQNNTLPFWKRITKMLPELEGKIEKYFSREQIQKVVTPILMERFEQENMLIEKSIKRKMKLIQQPIEKCISEMCSIYDLTEANLSKISCYMGYFNPFPRSVINKNYYVHYDISDEVFIRSSLHEINHMILFEKWKALYGYEKNEEPTFPEPLWYLEELSIEPTLNCERIQKLAPYKHYAYNSLYEIQIAGKTLPEAINSIYAESENIEQYLSNAYQYILSYIGIINNIK